MLVLLLGLAGFMLYAVNDPEMGARFARPEGFYRNTFEKVGLALLFALAVSASIALARKLMK